MQKFHEELLKTELPLPTQENHNMKINRNLQNRPEHTVIVPVLYTSTICYGSLSETGQVKWTSGMTPV